MTYILSDCWSSSHLQSLIRGMGAGMGLELWTNSKIRHNKDKGIPVCKRGTKENDRQDEQVHWRSRHHHPPAEQQSVTAGHAGVCSFKCSCFQPAGGGEAHSREGRKWSMFFYSLSVIVLFSIRPMINLFLPHPVYFQIKFNWLFVFQTIPR